MRLAFTIDAPGLTVLLLSCIVLLTTTHLFLSFLLYSGEDIHWLLFQMFDLDDEHNLPTWFSSFLLLATAIIIHSLDWPVEDQRHWKILSIGFLLLSLDEVAGIHETINTIIDMNWAIPAAILAGLIAVAFMPFIVRQPRRLRGMILLSGSMYVGGAVGVELMSAGIEEESLNYEIAVTAEESLEMLGIWMFLRSLLFIRPQKTSDHMDVC